MGGCGELIDVYTGYRVRSIPYSKKVEWMLGDPRASSRPPDELDDSLIYRMKRMTRFLETASHHTEYWKD